MADISITQRRIRPIQDAIASGQWKQALQLCDKWQKKGEKSDRFLALKASILVNQSERSQIDKGKAETLQLCRRTLPVTDVEALFQLQDNLKRLSIQNEEGPKLWERAISAVPNDKGLITTWLKGSISDGNWLMAQKAAMALRKAFPKERQYDFWNVLLCYLAHKDSSLTVKDQTLFGTLAYRLISKAAESVPTDKTQLSSPSKSIATPEELALLVHIFDSTGHADEAIKHLQSQSLGLTSHVAEQDPSMVFSLLLKALADSRDGGSVMTLCQSLLSDGHSRAETFAEDDRIWRILQEHSDQNDELQPDLMKLIDVVLLRQPECRAVHLAKLDLLTKLIRQTGQRKGMLEDAVKTYYQQFRTKPFCFADLIKAIHACSPTNVREILEETPTTGDVSDSQRILLLKFEYSMLSEATSSEAAFLAFACKAMQLSKSLPTDKPDRPEAVLLSGMSLLRLALKLRHPSFSIQASFLIDSAYAKFSEYYPLATRLVQVHRSLGLVSMAMQRFSSLSVKNMQWETVGHLLLTRISSLHPLRSSIAGDNPTAENFLSNPLQALDIGLDMLTHMEESLDNAIYRGLENGSYSNVLDSVTVKQNVHRSLNRQIFALEERKIQNLVGVPIDIQDAVEVGIRDRRPAELVDTRDFGFLNNYEAIDSGLETYLNCGPLPKEIWLDTTAVTDCLTTYLKSELDGQAMQAAESLESLQNMREKTAPLEMQQLGSQLTEAEVSSFQCHRLISDVIVNSNSKSASTTTQKDLDNILERVTTWLTSIEVASPPSVNGIEIPTWHFLHTCFTQLETVHIISLLAAFLFARNSTSQKGSGKSKANANTSININASKEKITKVKDSAINAENKIREHVKKTKEGINALGVLGKLIDIASGRLEDDRHSLVNASQEYTDLAETCADMYDEIALEEYCGKMKESWEDSLDGILHAKYGK